MPQVQAPAPKATPSEQTKTDWTLIEGNGRSILKTIAGILKSSGDSNFSVEFRIFQSSPAAEGSAPSQAKPQRHRRRGLGSLTSIFVPRRKRKS